MRTHEEIEKEVEKLKALKPMGAWALESMRLIKVAIYELEIGYDPGDGVWAKLTPSQKDIALTTAAWKRAEHDDSPSEGWGNLVDNPSQTVLPPMLPTKPTGNGNHPTT